MSTFQKRELSTCGGTEPTPPRAAVCFTTSAMTRRAADWLARLGGCRPLGILSDHGEDVIWQCEAENVDLLLLETDFSPAAEDTKDVSARCDIAIEVRRRLPECRVYLLCEDGHPEKQAALEKAVETVSAFDILREHGIMVCESPLDKALPQLEAPYERGKEYRYGKIKLTIYRKTGRELHG